MFDKAFEVYTKEAGFVREATLDILRAYLPYQDQKRINRLYETAVKTMLSKDHKEQKKSYKVMEEICSSDSEAGKDFLSKLLDPERNDNLQTVFLKSLSKASPSSQALRIRCLVHIVRRLTGEDEQHLYFVKSVIPEAVLCIKAVNEKARSGAYTLLIVIAEAMMNWGESDDALLDYIGTLSAGLAGEPSLVNCSLLAITRVFFEFRDVMPDELTEILLGNVCKLMTCASREVVGSALSFLRVFVQVNPVVKTGRKDILEKVVRAVMQMSEDCQRHFRLKTRYLLQRLVRKFGYDIIVAMVPKNDEIMQKRLKNIRKAQARKERHDEKNDVDDSDDDDGFRVRARPKTMEELLNEEDEDYDEMEVDLDKKKAKKKKKSAAFISESPEGIVDFLDPSAAQQVSSVKPKLSNEMKKEKTQSNRGFEIGSDGRLIIKDSDDESDEEPVKKTFGLMEDSDDDVADDKNTFEKLVSSSAARKRKHGGSVAASSIRTGRSTVREPAMKYQAGGSGIHRPLNKKPSDAEYGAEYRATKARGDVKKKGKADPYAYVPLQKSTLNKRKRAKYEGQFKNLVKAAKQGANAGVKSKNLSSKMKKMKV